MKKIFIILFSLCIFSCTSNSNDYLVKQELKIVKDWFTNEDKLESDIYKKFKNQKGSNVNDFEKALLKQQDKRIKSFDSLNLRTNEAKELGLSYIDVRSTMGNSAIVDAKYEKIKSPTESDDLEYREKNQIFLKTISQFHQKARELQKIYKVKLLD